MNSSPSPLDPGSGSDLCRTCGHPLSMHDAIGVRWCAATNLGGSPRACICSGVVAEARVLTHY
jgi:hypothetical protein